jgi:hypothetical protein
MSTVELFSDSGSAVFMSGYRGGVAKNEVTTVVIHLPVSGKLSSLPKGVSSALFGKAILCEHSRARFLRRSPSGLFDRRVRGSDSPSAVRYTRLHEK